ncbi:MAG: 16S rRNA (uracil(1498)-N(3))-methyltransferase [Planctomycetes bacterium]|nr:16S rRNA (uracil(1498)-N(3))-methyltransferase [Planctomycetota bacterium]
MNLLLLHEEELDRDGNTVLRDRRADHLRQVLAVQVGQRLRAGIVDGPLGHAEVLRVDGDGIAIHSECHTPTPLAEDVLLLAVPRPKVLQRMLEHATALGYGRILLCRSWRVEKSHLQSTLLQPDGMRPHLLAGLEQAGRTRLPAVRLFPLFKPFLEDVLPTLALPPSRICAHPPAATRTRDLALQPRQPFALALGPEGGWLPYEVSKLQEQGFVPVTAGQRPLRSESALSLLHGQLDLLRT